MGVDMRGGQVCAMPANVVMPCVVLFFSSGVCLAPGLHKRCMGPAGRCCCCIATHLGGGRRPCHPHTLCPCGHISSPAFALRLVARDGARDAAQIIFGPGRIAKAQLARSYFPCGAADERHGNLRAVATRVNDRASTVARLRLPLPSPQCALGANPPPWTVLFTCRAV